MNFLKSLGSLAGYNIPYNFLDKTQESCAENGNSSSIWSISQGTAKSDGSKCTIFSFEVKDPRNRNYEMLAKNATKKLKSTRIPGVLKIFDTIENDSNIYMISEPVIPLDVYLKSNELSNEALLLGIYVIAKALNHLHVDGKCVHGNVDISSIFVSESGEWKLGGFELMTNTQSDPDQPVYRQSSWLPNFGYIVPPEVAQKGVDSLRNDNSIFKLDSYKFGGLIWCVFSKFFDSKTISSTSQLLTINKIPKNVQPAYKKLLQNSLTARSTVEAFLAQGERSFFQIDLIRLYKELDEINLKSNSEKLEFMRSLESVKTTSPPGFMEYKIIPELVKLYNFSVQPNNYQQDMSSAATALYYILSFSESLDDDVFKKTVNPVIIQAFTFSDRTIRVTLLTSLSKYIDKLSKSEVSDKIFNNLLTGFSDTNTTIREETLKAILPVSAKLTDRQLSNELLRYLAKLQNDEKPEIRTNTVICLCKIATHLNSSSRAGVLITAYSKSLKDKFVPARNAALLSFEACIDYFTPEICCSRVLSAIAPCLLDKSGRVRVQAKKVFDLFMKKIEEEAIKLPAAEDEDEEDEFETPTIDPLTKASGHGLGFGFGINLNMISKMSGMGDIEKSDSPKSGTPLETTRSSTPLAKSEPSIKNSTGWNFDMDDDVPEAQLKPDKNLNIKESPSMNDAWDLNMDDENEFSEPETETTTANAAVSRLSLGKPKTTLKKSSGKSVAPKKSNGLTLGKTSKSSKLKLSLEDDDDWSGW